MLRRLLTALLFLAGLGAGLAASGVLAGCGLLGGRAAPPADARFGHRHAARADADRETLLIAVPADSASFLVFPAVVDSVLVRPERAVLPPGDSTAVEVLVKGALPDTCAELARVTQTRTGRYVSVSLAMRTPRGRVCAAVARPYRFYLPLDGHFAPGNYVLRLNGAAHPFQIRERAAAP